MLHFVLYISCCGPHFICFMLWARLCESLVRAPGVSNLARFNRRPPPLVLMLLLLLLQIRGSTRLVRCGIGHRPYRISLPTYHKNDGPFMVPWTVAQIGYRRLIQQIEGELVCIYIYIYIYICMYILCICCICINMVYIYISYIISYYMYRYLKADTFAADLFLSYRLG